MRSVQGGGTTWLPNNQGNDFCFDYNVTFPFLTFSPGPVLCAYTEAFPDAVSLVPECNVTWQAGDNRKTFTFKVNEPGGAGNIDSIQPFFSTVAYDQDFESPGGHGVGGCHMYFDSGTNVLYLDDPAVGNGHWLQWSALGTGGSDISSSVCTVHAGLSTVNRAGNSVDLLLDIEFPTLSQRTYYAYMSARNMGGVDTRPTWTGLGSWTVH